MEPEDASSSLIAILPDRLSQFVQRSTLDKDPDSLIEIVLDQGRPAIVRFSNNSVAESNFTVTSAEIFEICNHPSLGLFQTDNRAGIDGTLHRVSRLLDRQNNVIGLTLRVGRIVNRSIKLIADLLDSGKSIIVIGRPGKGKTSLLRQACCYLADEGFKRVMIVDTSNEICGDGVVPHPAVGNSRRIQVQRREQQYVTMREAVQNHMPEVIVVDEISDRNEAKACCSIAERGVQIIATAHGDNLESVVNNPDINDVVGKVMEAAMSDQVVKTTGCEKIKLIRRNKPAFDVAIEIIDFDKIAIHNDIRRSSDAILTGKVVRPEQRWIGPDGEVYTTPELIQEDQPTTIEEAFKKGTKITKVF